MKAILTAKNIILLLFCLVLAGLAVFAAFFVKDFFSEKPESILSETERDIVQDKEDRECVSSVEERIVRGNSLAPLIEDGQTVRVLFDYYDCNEIKREDLVLYDYAGSENPLIKIVKGAPGDRFVLQETDKGWHILINREILKNSEGVPYLISGKRYEMLALYEKDYQDGIRENAYLLLGDLPHGAVDATRFGFVHKDDILAKAEAISD